MAMVMDTSEDAVITDVWSRTAPKYRTRAVVLLLANMALFGAMCCFMFWLRTGWYFPPTYDDYGRTFWQTLDFATDQQVTLYTLYHEPISLKLVPMHAAVIGLMIASLVSIPILVSILYRFPASLPFCVMVALLAVMPWLGATLVLSCAIAAVGRVRVKFRFVAALLGLVPIGVYFFTASRGYIPPGDVLTPPIERGLLMAPLLLCALASCSLVAVVLTIARIVDYRPGAIAPLLALMFLTPWFVFTTEVGRDELHYRFLELHYGPQSQDFFVDADAGSAIRAVAMRLWTRQEEPRPTIDVLEDKVKRYFLAELEPTDLRMLEGSVELQSLDRLTEFARQQHHVASACDTFSRDFPHSRYVPGVLFVKGRALDMRVDLQAFRRSGVLRFYEDFPSEASRPTWTLLEENFPASPLANVARYRIAQLDARAGQVDRAIARLLQIVDPHHQDSDRPQPPSRQLSLEQLLAKKPPEASLQSEFADIPSRATELLSLLRRNREPANGDAALITYLNCDPRHAGYHANLQGILERFPHCKIRDNIELKLVLRQASLEERITGLHDLRQRHPQGDTLPQIIYELGLAHLDLGQVAEANVLFDELIGDFPDSTFATEALRRRPFRSPGGRTPGV